jgi:hypothetical protein
MAAETLKVAEWLVDQRGFSVIPLDHPSNTSQSDPGRIGKVPRLPSWKEYQSRRPTRDELKSWFGNGQLRNVGIVTGAVSGLIVVDCDSPEAIAWADKHLPATPMVTRTAKGEHRAYRHPGTPIRNKVRVKTGDTQLYMDVRADGGFVVGPGSLHRSGFVYERVGDWPPVTDLPQFNPDWLATDHAAPQPSGPLPTPFPPGAEEHGRVVGRARAYLAALPSAVQGQGGDLQTLKAACRIVRGFDLSDSEALELLRDWNTGCVPPWSEADLVRKIRSARQYGREPVGGLRNTPLPKSVSRSSREHLRPSVATPRINTAPLGEADPRPPAARGPDTDAAWVRDPRGAVVANNLDNIRVGLARLGIVMTSDTFQRQLCLNGVPLDDADIDRIWVRFNDSFGFRPGKDVLRTVLVTEGDASPVHPVREYLDSLEWDGTPRLDRWLVTYAGAVDSPYVQAVGALPLVAAVRRVRQPGAKFDELLILESTQGAGKSSALRALCPREDWFGDDLPLGVDSKQVIERTAGRWLIEAAELHGNRGREVEQLKAFLSRQTDGPVRLAYARLSTSVPRQFVLIGTTNARTAYLKDTTGARRFWPVRVGTFDIEALVRHRDQIWAEAAAREAAGASIRLNSAMWDAATAEQEGRRATDPWEDILAPLLDGDGITSPEQVPVSAVWDALGLPNAYRDNRAADRVAAIAQRHGFTRKGKVRLGASTVRVWKREETTEEA